MTSQNILFVTTGLGYGGAETQLVRLAVGLGSRGWRVQVVSMLPPQAFLYELEQASIPVHSLSMRRGVPDPRGLFRLMGILRHERPVILTSFLYHANLLGRIAGQLMGVPVVISSIRNEKFGGLVADRMTRLTDRLADITTINSNLAGEAVVRRGVVPDEKLKVIPNGLDITRFSWTQEARMQVRKELEIAETHFLWLAIGRLDEQKNYPNLLSAFAQVVSRYPKTMLLVAGEGALRQTLDEMVSFVGLEQYVHFLGVRTDIPNLLAAADAFVLASAWEGLPNVVMEALAARKPVVATEVGGVPELVKEDKNGFLVPSGDSEALAQAMLDLMNLPLVERLCMGERGFKHLEANYSIERVIDQWEALYIDLLLKKGYRVIDATL